MDSSTPASANLQPDPTKEWARPARLTAFIVPIPSHALLLSVLLLFATENAEVEANTVFVDLTTVDAADARAAESAETNDFEP
ncbi:hypothetical protein C8R44DRAFT_888055 [Mycena epipterygia]|nr:hypothetical protein C8R44DRAFT_888055 [Mycena epipterygia]